ncbi:hypothetical protein SAMN05444377_10554 [Flavobacterium fontis]|uniref:Lipoprotein n=1 Tax=Flavobacterium fontis TaxID=1124188 RepID=A0A1M4ZWK8_9FLAO|nr:hypothetical protein [Flavobacterium fontis]SHF22408.1 hypothetical protein SAMN05444377_10554 [Flavobacterium fontis]
MKFKVFPIFIFIVVIASCSKKNDRIENWPRGYEKENPFHPDTIFEDGSFSFSCQFRVTSKIESVKQKARIYDNKFYLKFLDVNAEEFVFLDFKCKKNELRTITINCNDFTKTYKCILENTVNVDKNINVKIFRIEKLIRLSDFFGGKELDLVVLATEKHGIIGTYLQEGNTIISARGDILKDLIDYNKYNFARLL